jgi:hypothetical protein
MAAPSTDLLPLPPKDRSELVRVEKNLNSFGFFTPSHKRLEGLTEKTVTIFVHNQGGRRAEARATILPNAKFGLPTTGDQDKYFAFQKIVEDLRRRAGRVDNPIGFTSARLLKILGRKKSGQGYQEIAEWLDRMTLTGIRSEGVVYFAGSRKYMRDTFTVFSRVISMGKVMPDGKTADQNYIWLSDWQLENLNASHVLPIDYEAYRALRLNISKALVPLVQIWFYAARRNSLSIEKRYSELCELLSIRQYPHLSKIKEILGPSLDEMKSLAILQSWDILRTADNTDYKIVLHPGERFMTERRARLIDGSAQRNVVDPRFDAALEAMIGRGIVEDRARRLLFDLPDDQPIVDQLEYGDYEIARRGRTRDPIQNPPGFYVYLLQSNFPVPAAFETSRKCRLRLLAAERRQAAQASAADEELRQETLRAQYNEYVEREAQAWIDATFTPSDVARHIKAARAAIARDFPDLRLPEPALQEFALRRVRQSCAARAGVAGFEEFCQQRQMTLNLLPE